MKVVTVRSADGTLISFGPANGDYDPGVPAGATKQIEADYKVVQAEATARYVAPLDPMVALQTKVAELETRISVIEGSVKSK